MFSTSKIVALLSVLSTSALAADVYSSFLNSNNAEIGSTQFDVSNTGCFSVGGAVSVSFSQSGSASTAGGPYCLTGYSEGGCTGNAVSQQFQNINLYQAYSLNDGVSNTGSYKWAANGC